MNIEERKRIEAIVENDIGASFPLSDKAHEIYQTVASSTPLVVVRTIEERRVIDNFALIGRALKREVYHWSLTSNMYRCMPDLSNLQKMVAEPVELSQEGQRKVPGMGIHVVSYYLLKEWQHPYRGANPELNSTSRYNRTDMTADESKGSVIILKDAHMLLSGTNNTLGLRMFKDLIEAITWQVVDRPSVSGRQDNSLTDMTIVITAPVGWEIPAEIRDLASDIMFPRPNEDELSSLLYGLANLTKGDNSAKSKKMEDQEKRILHAATGLHAKGFIDSIKVSCVEQKLDGNDPYEIRHDIIATSKKSAIKAGGAINYEEPNWSMNDVGGHDFLKNYLNERAVFFDPNNPISERLPEGVKLPMPKGVLMVGIPGCGKSLEAKAMASLLDVPLLTLDMGAVFTGIVGGSEQRVREALQLAEDCAPCVMRIEEIEKALSGSGSSNFSDGGTTNRVFQTILNWLQEHDKPVFVVATANDVSQLPPELLRKGRFDEIFFVDLPVAEERKEIFKIHLRRHVGLAEEEIDERFNLSELALASNNFSGAEIEALIKASLYRAIFEHQQADTLSEFMFEQRHIHETIGPSNGPRTFRILYDSEFEKLAAMREIARKSWVSASSYEIGTSDTEVAPSTGKPGESFFNEASPKKRARAQKEETN